MAKKGIELLVNIRGSAKTADKQAGTISGMFGKTANIIGYVGALKNISKMLTSLTQSQSEYIETLNLMQQAFGDTTLEAQKFVDSIAGMTGFDKAGLTKDLSIFREMSAALGYTSETADTLSKNLLQMQLELSSMFDMDISAVGQKLQSAMAG